MTPKSGKSKLCGSKPTTFLSIDTTQQTISKSIFIHFHQQKNNLNMSAPAKKSAKKAAPKQPSFIFMICKAIGGVKGGHKGASRPAIAAWIQKNFNKEGGARFNASLRNALKKGIESGILRAGDSAQRFKLGEKAKSITNPPKPKKKKVVKKKKTTKKKKKKVTKKKKKVTKKKKKTVSKKKKTTKKKKVTKKKKPAKKTTKKKVTKKKTVSKKKPAKKVSKKKTTKKGKK